MKPGPVNIADIILRMLKQEASEADIQLLNEWKHLEPEHQAFLEKLLEIGYIPQGLKELSDAQARTAMLLAGKGIVLHQKTEDQNLSSQLFTARKQQVPLLYKWRWAAAVLIIYLSAAVVFLITDNRSKQRIPEVATTTIQDVRPGGNKATLTLSDGTVIKLDSTANGAIAQQGNTSIIKLADGQVAYDLKGSNRREVMMNTMATPRGGQYQLSLPDGTKVWLNAASAITYPAAFEAKERRVKISGEVYFEVAKDKTKPFIVDAGDNISIEVLGTMFNINSYPDEGTLRTTLLEGSVKVIRKPFATGSPQPLSSRTKNDKTAVVLNPGQQAELLATIIGDQLHSGEAIRVHSNIDLAKVMAWKNGQFNFENADIREVMLQLSRWYDIEVQYEGKIPEVEFIGKISRNLSLSSVLDALAGNDVHFRLESGRKLIVLP